MYCPYLNMASTLLTIMFAVRRSVQRDAIVIGHECFSKAVDHSAVRLELQTRKHRLELFGNAIEGGEQLRQLVCFIAHRFILPKDSRNVQGPGSTIIETCFDIRPLIHLVTKDLGRVNRMTIAR